jgi:diacylglycerol kinase family enzyme
MLPARGPDGHATNHPVKTERPRDVALLCNPQAGGRWRVLADVLDSDEAKSAHRIVTDEIDDVREAIAGLGQRVKLLCIYGGDGTIYRVINELLRNPKAPPPRLALLGGGTMNVTSAWCGMRRAAGENFRQVMRAYAADQLLWREVPLVAVTQKGQTSYGFTFGMGPLVRILEHYERGTKTRANALVVGVKTAIGAVSGIPRDYQPMLREMEARITVDGQPLPHERWVATFANVTGVINPFVAPFVNDRTRDSFHFLSYAVSSREFAVMAPLLARARLPIDPRQLLHPISTWRQALLSMVGRGGIAADPRYINHPARTLVIESDETHYTIDGEVFPSIDRRFEVRLGPTLHLATLTPRRRPVIDPARRRKPKQTKSATRPQAQA